MQGATASSATRSPRVSAVVACLRKGVRAAHSVLGRFAVPFSRGGVGVTRHWYAPLRDKQGSSPPAASTKHGDTPLEKRPARAWARGAGLCPSLRSRPASALADYAQSCGGGSPEPFSNAAQHPTPPASEHTATHAPVRAVTKPVSANEPAFPMPVIDPASPAGELVPANDPTLLALFPGLAGAPGAGFCSQPDNTLASKSDFARREPAAPFFQSKNACVV